MGDAVITPRIKRKSLSQLVPEGRCPAFRAIVYIRGAMMFEPIACAAITIQRFARICIVFASLDAVFAWSLQTFIYVMQ